MEDIKEGLGEYRAKVSTPCRDVATSGKYRYFAGDYYVGQYHKNNRHGIGKQTSENGEIYEGEWVDHYKSGRGKLTRVNGEEIEGIWENDVLRTILSRTAPSTKVLSAAGPPMKYIEQPVDYSQCIKLLLALMLLLLLLAITLLLLSLRPPLVSISSDVSSLQRCFVIDIS